MLSKRLFALGLIGGTGLLLAQSAGSRLTLTIDAKNTAIQKNWLHVTATITNNSQSNVNVVEVIGDATSQYNLSVLTHDHLPVSSTQCTDAPDEEDSPPQLYSKSSRTLMPGEHMEETMEFDALCHFERPGTFIIKLDRFIAPGLAGLANSHLASNELQVEIKR